MLVDYAHGCVCQWGGVSPLSSPECGGNAACASCSTRIGSQDPDKTDLGVTMPHVADTGWSRATRVGSLRSGAALSLDVGSVIADRYEILKLLGEGGMGAVYKAKDHELDRQVALKVIRPELAGHPSVLQRFKQELILARKITHRNVIRIYRSRRR